MSAESILKMIEEVDVNDEQQMREVQKSVHDYIEVKKHVYRVVSGDLCYIETEDGFDMQIMVEDYTRSRDALKAIRPEGWTLDSLVHYGSRSENTKFWKAEMHINGGRIYIVASKGLVTEELAELHAIIQAIEHTRKGAKE